MSGHRRVLLTIGMLGVVSLAVAAWVVGSQVQSSSQAAAQAQPPERSLVTAPIERRILSATMITRADVVPAGSVAVAGPTLDTQGGPGSAVVTGVFVNRGDEVSVGMRLVEVAGRPVFVLEGETPVFRAMRPGVAGEDVSQLQQGLVAAGCEAGDSGVYDQATKVCVEQFYADAGYIAVRGSETESADLATAETAVAEAQDALEVAQNDLDAVAEPGGSADTVAAQAAVNDAQRSHDAEIAERPGLIDTATRIANNAVDSAAGALDVTNESLTVVRDDPASTADLLASAQLAVDDAQRTYDTAVAEQPKLIDTATRDADNAVASTGDALTAAQARLTDTTTGADTSALELAVEQQQGAVDRAVQAQTDLESASGAIVPFGEIVFIPQLPARVDAVNAIVGQSNSADGTTGGEGSLMVLASPILDATVSVPQAERALVQEGTSVELLYEATGETVTGTVRTIGDELEPAGDSAVPSYPAVIDADLAESWSGLNLRATFTASSTENEVLVVPSAAVSSAADGQTRIQIERADGTAATVAVTPGLSADGFVEITPDDASSLDEGDRVVTG